MKDDYDGEGCEIHFKAGRNEAHNSKKSDLADSMLITDNQVHQENKEDVNHGRHNYENPNQLKDSMSGIQIAGDLEENDESNKDEKFETFKENSTLKTTSGDRKDGMKRTDTDNITMKVVNEENTVKNISKLEEGEKNKELVTHSKHMQGWVASKGMSMSMGMKKQWCKCTHSLSLNILIKHKIYRI